MTECVTSGEYCRFRLQRRERIYKPCVIGNRSYPLPTYRWKDIAASEDRTALEDILRSCEPRENYRVIDTRNNGEIL